MELTRASCVARHPGACIPDQRCMGAFTLLHEFPSCGLGLMTHSTPGTLLCALGVVPGHPAGRQHGTIHLSHSVTAVTHMGGCEKSECAPEGPDP